MQDTTDREVDAEPKLVDQPEAHAPSECFYYRLIESDRRKVVGACFWNDVESDGSAHGIERGKSLARCFAQDQSPAASQYSIRVRDNCLLRARIRHVEQKAFADDRPCGSIGL